VHIWSIYLLSIFYPIFYLFCLFLFHNAYKEKMCNWNRLKSLVIYTYFACLFVSDKRQNGWTDQAQFLYGTSLDRFIDVQNSIFNKFNKSTTVFYNIRELFCFCTNRKCLQIQKKIKSLILYCTKGQFNSFISQKNTIMTKNRSKNDTKCLERYI